MQEPFSPKSRPRASVARTDRCAGPGHPPPQTVKARRAKRKNGNKPPKWQQKMREGTAKTTFVIGILLSFPGVTYLAALDRLHKLHYSTVVRVLVMIGINLVQLLLLEIPMLAFKVAPRQTPAAIEHAKAWFRGHARELAAAGLAVIGGWLAIRGVVNLH